MSDIIKITLYCSPIIKCPSSCEVHCQNEKGSSSTSFSCSAFQSGWQNMWFWFSTLCGATKSLRIARFFP